jgi:hypothetical protein
MAILPGGSGGPTKDNLDIAIQLASTIAQITSQLKEQTSVYQRQVELVEAICRGQECFRDIDPSKFKEMSDHLRAVHGDMDKFSEQAKESTKLTGKLGEALEKAVDWAKKLSVPAEFLNGFRAGFTLTTGLFKNILSLGGTAFELLKNLGGILLSIPGRIMDFFQGAAGGGGADPYKQSLEEVRKEFGNLEVGTSKAIVHMTKDLHGFNESGVKFSRVFGFGREGMANLLRENLELAKAMGPMFQRLAGTLGENSRDFTILRKATGLEGEAMKSLVLSAEDAGESMESVTKRMTKELAQAERTFNISVKEFGRDINAMLKDTATFGHQAPEVMIRTSAYVKKLGISIETLKKTMDASFNFEDAAQEAAGLAEAFNINIGSMELFSETDSTKKLDMIRKGFFETGRSVESLGVHEMKALAGITHLSDEELRISFSQSKRAMSQASINEQMKKGQKHQMTQVEAMQTLAKSIERLTQSGSGMKGSFFDVFMKGFETGIMRSREFREVVRSLQQAMRVVYRAGIEVGHMFVELFPGIKGILKGLAGLFSPSMFRGLMSQVVSEFRNFFTAIRTDPAAGFESFMKNMKRIFIDFFTKGTPAGSRFLDGMKDFFKTVGIIFIQGLKFALNTVAELLRGVINYIKNPSSLNNAAAEAGDGLKGMFLQALNYAVEALRPVLSQIGSLFVELLSELYTKYIQPRLGTIIFGAIAFFFGPAIVMGFVRGATAALLGQGIPAIVNMIRGASTATSTVNAAGAAVADNPANLASNMWKTTKDLLKLAPAFIAFTLAVGLVVGGIILLAMLFEKAFKDKESGMKSVVFIVGVFAVVGLLFVGLVKSGFLKAASELNINLKGIGNILKNIGVGMLAIGLVMAATALMLRGSIYLLGDVTKEKIDLFVNAFKSMSELIGRTAVIMAVMVGVGAALAYTSGTVAVSLVVGLVAIGLVMAAIAEFASKTITSFAEKMTTAGVTPEFAQVVTGILSSFIDLVLKLSGSIATLARNSVFAAIGGAISRFFGGRSNSPFDSLKTVLEIITKSVLDITRELSQMSGDPNILKEKANIFTSIATGLASLLGPVLQTVNLVIRSGSGFTGISSSALVKAMAPITSIVGLLSNPDSNTGIISSLIKGISDMLTATPNIELLKTGAGVFSTITTGLGALITSIVGLLGALDVSLGQSVLLSGPGAAKAKLDAVKAIATDVIPSISTAISSLIRSISGMVTETTNIEGMKAFAPLLGSISELVGGVLTAIGSLLSNSNGGFAEAYDSVVNVLSGGSSNDVLTQKLTKIQEFVTTFTGSITSMLNGTDGHSGIIGSIVDLISKTPSDPQKLKGLSVVADILKSMTGFIPPIIQAVASLTQNIKGGQGVSNAQIAEIGLTISSVLNVLTSSFGTIFLIIPNLIRNLLAITIPPGMETRVKALNGIFTFIRDITATINSFTVQLGGGKTRQMTAEEITAPISGLLDFFSGPGKQKIQTLLSSIKGLNFHGTSSNIASLKGLFESIKLIAEASKSLKDLGGTDQAVLRYDVMSVPLSNIAVIIAGIKSNTTLTGQINPLTDRNGFKGLDSMKERLHGKGALLRAVADQITEINTATTSITSLPTSTTPVTEDKLATLMSNQGKVLTLLRQNYGDNETGNANVASIRETTRNIRSELVADLTSMVTAYNQFSRDLTILNGIPSMDVTLQRFGTNLHATRIAKIHNASVNVTFNIDVTLKAGDVEDALFRQFRVDGREHAPQAGKFSNTAFNTPAADTPPAPH